jgi:hypothetical protein
MGELSKIVQYLVREGKERQLAKREFLAFLQLVLSNQ